METKIELNVRFKTYGNHIYKRSQDFNSEDLDRGRKKQTQWAAVGPEPWGLLRKSAVAGWDG